MYLRLDWDPNFLKLIFLTQQQIACNSHVIFTREREREREEWRTHGRGSRHREKTRGATRGLSCFDSDRKSGGGWGIFSSTVLMSASTPSIQPHPVLISSMGFFVFCFFNFVKSKANFSQKIAKLVEFTLQKPILQKHCQLFIFSLKWQKVSKKEIPLIIWPCFCEKFPTNAKIKLFLSHIPSVLGEKIAKFQKNNNLKLSVKI